MTYPGFAPTTYLGLDIAPGTTLALSQVIIEPIAISDDGGSGLPPDLLYVQAQLNNTNDIALQLKAALKGYPSGGPLALAKSLPPPAMCEGCMDKYGAVQSAISQEEGFIKESTPVVGQALT